ncbi:hypothetical protein [Endozoicomonas arenosclerae]|uniref:hypothetical protein n=1 Tax=Endozoicomonas arenosclerae TaxID=1633495 RepID=UPI0007853776|nr:hypothetical protein [Endozoicomonas arenosclerae]
MSPAIVRAEIIATIHDTPVAENTVSEQDVQETREKVQKIKQQLSQLEKLEAKSKETPSSVSFDELIGAMDFIEYTEKLKSLRFNLAFRD